MNHPILIQGGMGIAVSDWRLAKSVAETGQLGVVSGTAINSVLVRRLQDGDFEGHCRRALAAFPHQEIAKNILDSYFIEGGRDPQKAYKRAPMFNIESPKSLLQLTVAACFVEVWLAKEGHNGVVGLNLLEKIQLPNLACLYGAMLANVDYVIMGAGIPREIPGVLDLFAKNQKAGIKISVDNHPEGHVMTWFDPAVVMEGIDLKDLHRPYFFPIVSSATLALNLKRKSTGEINGFIVEGPLAGGHNAPPRGPMKLNDAGEPIYGPRDEVNFEEMNDIGLPYWMAGYYATPEKIAEVRAKGAHGVQAGTLFAFCTESGVSSKLRRESLEVIKTTKAPEGGWIFTDPRSSPTGFPFKAAKLPGSVAQKDIYEARKRICDLGYLRHAFQKEDGSIAQRCPAEPVQDYIKKGGTEEETVGRKCLCNALFADVGMPQIQAGGAVETHLLTAGDDLNNVARLFKNGNVDYSAKDVVAYLLGKELNTTKASHAEAGVTAHL